MAFFVADRVKETTTSTGTGTINLAGAESGFQSFVSGIGNGNTTYYAIIDASNETWEVGVGVITRADPDTLSRDTILASSNAGSAVNFGAGEKSVFVTQPSDKAVYKDSDSDDVTIDKVQLEVQTGHPPYSEGLLWYDQIHNTLNYYGDEPDLVHEVGMEEHQKVYNNSGVTINKGEPMYFSGNFNGYPTVGKADATDVNKYNAQGLAGHDIENNSFGYLITAGLVEDVDTSGLNAGNNFFVGLTPGSVQNSSPTYPNYPMCLGWVVNSDASSGILLVNQQNHSVNSFRVRTDTHIGGDLIIDGDLTVVGSQTIASSTNVETGAPFLYLNSGDSIGEANTTFTGSGLDDAYFAGHFSGTASTTYYVKIDATGTPDTFSWSKDNFSTTEATGVSITGGEQTLDNGIKIDFGATTGHTLNDVWSGTATPVDVDTGIWSNRNTGGTGVGYTHVGMFFDVTDSKFKLVDEYDPEPEGVINTGHSSYSAGTLVVDSVEASSASISGNITVTGTVDGRDVGADGSKLDSIEAGATADQTASEILTLIKTVDGSGSGLDADTLDGINSGSFLRSDQSDSTSGQLTVQTLSVGTNNVGNTSDIALSSNVAINAESSLSYGLTDASAGYYRWMFGNTSKTSGIGGGTEKMRLDKDGNLTLSGTVDGRDIAADGTKLDGIESGATADQTASEILTAIKTVDGSGSGLDADLIDGVQGPFSKEGGTDFNGTYPLLMRVASNNNYSNSGITYTGSTDTLNLLGNISITGTVDGRDVSADGAKLDGIESGATADQTATEILTAIKTVDGSGSGLDADTLDGAQPSASASNSTIVQRSSNGYIYANYLNTTANDVSSGVTRVMVETGNDNFIRHGTQAAIRTFIGAGSGNGLDADTVDGIQGSSFLRSDTADTCSGDISFTGGAGAITITNSDIRSNATSNWTGDPQTQGKIQYHANRWYIVADSSSNRIVQFRRNNSDRSYIDNNGKYMGDTDLLDGQHGSYYLNYNNLSNTPSIPSPANNATITLSAGTGLSGGGNFTTNQSSAETITFNLEAPYTYIDQATGNYGTIKVDDDRGVTWAGYAIRDDWVFMSNGAGNAGIYNDTDNEWVLYAAQNSWTRIYHNGQTKIETVNNGIKVLGASASSSSIEIRGSDDDLFGYVYGSDSSYIGFLDDDGNWAYQHLKDTHHQWYINSQQRMFIDNSTLKITTTADEKISLEGTSNPYIRWCEDTTDRAYIQYVSGTNSFRFRNQESGNFDVMSPSNAAINVRYMGSDGDIWGSVYATDSQEIGFLDEGGSWAFRIVNDSRMEFRIGAQEEMRLESDGDLHVEGDVIAFSTTVSDRRLKDNIKNIENALDKVDQINGVTFLRKANGQESAGVIAQEIMEVLPEAVKEKALPLLNENSDEKYYVVEYDAVTGLLVEAIKELKSRVEALEVK